MIHSAIQFDSFNSIDYFYSPLLTSLALLLLSGSVYLWLVLLKTFPDVLYFPYTSATFLSSFPERWCSHSHRTEY